jgi:hypothetical protein
VYLKVSPMRFYDVLRYEASSHLGSLVHQDHGVERRRIEG